MKSQSSQLEELERWVRAGNFEPVKRALDNLNPRKIERKNLVQYAYIANRVDHSRVGHRILHSVVRSEKVSPSEEEKIEYAEALRLMGLYSEAKKILNEVDSDHYPIASLRMAFCLMPQWQYNEAIPHLRKCIANVDQKEYLSLIAKMNLAAALVGERIDAEAMTLLEQLKEESERRGHRLLYCNSLELMAQLFIHQGKYNLADQTIGLAAGVIGDLPSRFSLYLRKWSAISQSLQLRSVHPDLVQCRQIAIENMDWETARDCDLYIGFLSKNQNLIQHVYFGTPFQTYRNRIVDLTGTEISKSYIWTQSDQPVTDAFDLIDGRSAATGDQLEIGHLIHRALVLLCSDFYRPLSICTAFSELFPGENFSQQGSANRVVQSIKRLRAWCKEDGDRFMIEEKSGYYRLRMRPGVGLRVPNEMPSLSLESLTWEKMARGLEQVSFSRHEVIERLLCSSASATRLLRWAVANGEVDVIGGGPSRRYRLVS